MDTKPSRTNPTDELLTLDRALTELGDVPRSTFFRWKALGRAPKTIKYPNGSLRIRRSDLDTWIANHEEPAGARTDLVEVPNGQS